MVVESDDVIITSYIGGAWNKHQFAHKHWMVDVTLSVSGKLKHGADGMVS